MSRADPGIREAPTPWTAGQPGRDAYGFMTRAIA